MTQDRLTFLALHFTPGVGDHLVKQLVSYCGSAEEVFKIPKGKLLKIPGIGPVTAESIKARSSFHQAEKELKKAEKEETEILFYTDKNYPDRLKEIEDAPSLLYCKGTINLNFEKSVAIVGTRQATDYGKETVSKIIEDLRPHQTVIVSGLAYGIDIQAHKQALKNDLPTLAVLGSGMDVIYPSAHKETAKKIMNHGAMLTENHFGTQPDAHNFPARNRIIAGLCDALIVVEAAEKGGALITAEIANSYNKDVFAVPGSLGNTYSEGCNKLIRNNKATIYTSIKDLEYLMNWSTEHLQKKKIKLDFTSFSVDEQKVLSILHEKKRPMMIDELTIKTALSPSVLASLLLNLEFSNVVKSLPGKQFALIAN
ncbi:MAG: DNA-processing protein DprA [Cytophagales bacterium]|jgi:DNA processing protein|nr:DNA-protecting protein DprA [Bacteroidota bacterium]MBS1982018.1 DNA-protecting protein DprA [Bacteroidota bacterium]WHZ09473.1 MAG: DNA-processing protein DprA [Cytophagales bacterium]